MPEDAYLGDIYISAANFAPRDYALCDGQLISIQQNEALFSILGTTYGGDGVRTFALPDFRGRAPLHAGDGYFLTPHVIGETGGSETVSLIANQLPSHTHPAQGVDGPGNTNSPAGALWAKDESGQTGYYSDAPPDAAMDPSALKPAGSGTPHTNMQPYLSLSFYIALQGIFPSRN